MDTMYQRGKIQDESMLYEQLKHTGELPLIGVNTFLPKDGHGEQIDKLELMRSTEDEKQQQIVNGRAFQDRGADRRPVVLAHLQEVARSGGNTFEALMEAVKYASLGQISGALYDVGGEYRRNM
jgi:methylmalonyl-CoA mutase